MAATLPARTGPPVPARRRHRRSARTVEPTDVHGRPRTPHSLSVLVTPSVRRGALRHPPGWGMPAQRSWLRKSLRMVMLPPWRPRANIAPLGFSRPRSSYSASFYGYCAWRFGKSRLTRSGDCWADRCGIYYSRDTHGRGDMENDTIRWAARVARPGVRSGPTLFGGSGRHLSGHPVGLFGRGSAGVAARHGPRMLFGDCQVRLSRQPDAAEAACRARRTQAAATCAEIGGGRL